MTELTVTWLMKLLEIDSNKIKLNQHWMIVLQLQPWIIWNRKLSEPEFRNFQLYQKPIRYHLFTMDSRKTILTNHKVVHLMSPTIGSTNQIPDSCLHIMLKI